MPISTPPVYDESALLERLTEGARRNARNVCFLLGSPVSAPCPADSPGVPDVSGVVELARREFEGQALDDFQQALNEASNPYQAAFTFLLGRRGADVANQVVKQAVWRSRKRAPRADDLGSYLPTVDTTDDACQLLDEDVAGWHFSPAMAAIGSLLSRESQKFGRCVLTTNFDPLIENAITAAGGNVFRTVLHRDGDFSHTTGSATHVVHLHGYWHGSDTLHTSRQLNQERPRLKAALSRLLGQSTLVVSGYGGWDDVFTRTLIDVVTDDGAQPEILWTLYKTAAEMPAQLLELLSPGIDRGRVTLYENIDCNTFFPRLARDWVPADARAQPEPVPPATEFVDRYFNELSPAISQSESVAEYVFPQSDRDRPPIIDFYVGRTSDLSTVAASRATVTFITGIGGQGKSALAGRCLSHQDIRSQYDYFIWRDCKEESDRFEAHICTLTSVLSKGRVTIAELSSIDIRDVTKIFVQHLKSNKICIVFDNVDHYVDLESGKLTGVPALLCAELAGAPISSRLIFTCRPEIKNVGEHILSHRLEGLDVKATAELLILRGAHAELSEVTLAHQLTRGHALWLDLLASQLARNPALTLPDLLHDLAAGDAEIPTATLSSIWNTLKDRERSVLRHLAETVAPTTELQLADYIRRTTNYNQMAKAIKSLRGLNLLVSRAIEDGQEVLELHPLVRAFVRTTFPRAERKTFIDAIIGVYSMLIRTHRKDISNSPSAAIVNYWLGGAELYLESGNYKAAFETLSDVRTAAALQGSQGEFLRISRMLFDRLDWSKWTEYKSFDDLVEKYISLLSDAGDAESASSNLDKYFETCSGKDARYINYCNMSCYFHWMGGNFSAAVKWGAEGVALKDTSGVDTQFDCRHNLALAQRDFGLIDTALSHFLRGKELVTVTDATKIDAALGGDYYGNIGRCLQLMGNLSSAETCLVKSAVLLESIEIRDNVLNEGYIRQWLGELNLALGHPNVGIAFLQASIGRWDLVAPPKADRVRRLISGVEDPSDSRIPVSVDQGERIFLRWVREQPISKLL